MWSCWRSLLRSRCWCTRLHHKQSPSVWWKDATVAQRSATSHDLTSESSASSARQTAPSKSLPSWRQTKRCVWTLRSGGCSSTWRMPSTRWRNPNRASNPKVLLSCHTYVTCNERSSSSLYSTYPGCVLQPFAWNILMTLHHQHKPTNSVCVSIITYRDPRC